MRIPTFRTTALALVGLLVVMQLVPINHDNPAATAGPLTAPAPVVSILRRACADCHSHDTVWPWYSHVAPSSWFVIDHVDHGRKHLNLSDWTQTGRHAEMTNPDAQFNAMCEQVERGDMPLSSYLILHPDAKLTDEDRRVLCAWAKAAPRGK